MNIEELDEAQGLTAHDVRQWLKTQAPRIKRTTNVMTVTGMGDLWTWPSGDTVRDAKMDAWLPDRVRDIASLEGRTVQSLLREINPRMRPWPSLEAVEAHQKNGGRWVSKAPGDELIRCMTAISLPCHSGTPSRSGQRILLPWASIGQNVQPSQSQAHQSLPWSSVAMTGSSSVRSALSGAAQDERGSRREAPRAGRAGEADH